MSPSNLNSRWRRDFERCSKEPDRLVPLGPLASRLNERGTALISFIRVSCMLLVLIMGTGCSSTNGKKYTFRNMPPDLLAQKRENVQTLDLTRIAKTGTNSNVIDRGDVIEVAISAGLNEKDTIKIPVRVAENGTANLPEIGPIQLAGLETQAAEAVIVEACLDRQLYRTLTVTVTMKQQRMNRVTVVGAVKSPGVHQLPRGQSDLLAALVAADGLDKDAGTNVEIRNPKATSGSRSPAVAGGPSINGGVNPIGHLNLEPTGAEGGVSESIRVDLVSATKSGTNSYLLSDGAVVMVEKRDPEPLHVMGLVQRPNRYEFPIAEDVRVTDAIALAGGLSSQVADKVFVIRRKPESSETVVIQISLMQAKRDSAANLRLSPGDVVSVEQTPATFAIDMVRNFVRFGFSAGLGIF